MHTSYRGNCHCSQWEKGESLKCLELQGCKIYTRHCERWKGSKIQYSWKDGKLHNLTFEPIATEMYRCMVCKWEVEAPWKWKFKREETHRTSDPRDKRTCRKIWQWSPNSATYHHNNNHTVSLTYPYRWEELLQSNSRQLSSWENGDIYFIFIFQ